MDKDRRTAFSIADLSKTHEIADKDNAKPVAPRPTHIRVPQPRLAPTGMGGIRVPQPRLEMMREAAQIRVPKPPREVGKPSEVNREFRSIVTPSPDKDRGRSR